MDTEMDAGLEWKLSKMAFFKVFSEGLPYLMGFWVCFGPLRKPKMP